MVRENPGIKKVGVIGLGYVGLPTLVAIASTNIYEVVGYDVDKVKISKIKKGLSPINDETVATFLKQENLAVSDNPSILKHCDVFIICVPTPIFNDYTPDYRFVIAAAETVARFLEKGSHLVLESTVNPGTCKEVIIPLLKEQTKLKPGLDFNIAHCPERINPGDDHWTINNIPRNIGSIRSSLNKQIANFYRSFIKDAAINEVGSLEIAEATKIVENTFRDINIAFANELAKSFDAMGIDFYETMKGAANKPFSFLAHWPGCGVGGHCIAVDPYYLINRAAKSGFDHQFLKLARTINNSMPEYTVQKLIGALNNVGLPVKQTKIALLGLSYKPNIGDTRESPALVIKQKLEKLGAKVSVFDPYLVHTTTLSKTILGVSAIVIATAHKQFIDELPILLKQTKVRVVVDGRNCLNKSGIEKLGITYVGIGR